MLNGSSSLANLRAQTLFSAVPKEIANDENILKAISILPKNYNFEIFKSIWKIRSNKSKRVGLQFPDGLKIYATSIVSILEQFTGAEFIILSDLVYGACCVDDFLAESVNCDFLIHYGHSCLIPIYEMVNNLKMLYVFVDIKFDIQHLIDTIYMNFAKGSRFAIVGTIQFVSTIQSVAALLRSDFDVILPQAKPLSPGEILGCTSKKIEENIDFVIAVCDGRFHIESMMISNPNFTYYQYSPYSKVLTEEVYRYEKMLALRLDAIEKAKNAKLFGIVLGTLGRQGSPKIVDMLIKKLKKYSKKSIVILISEITSEKLNKFKYIDAWIQIACPRLSIDWGHEFIKPLLNPYEAYIALGENSPLKKSPNQPLKEIEYTMDFYRKDSIGPWSVNHACHSLRANPNNKCNFCK